jgi:malate dehydrogenase
MNKQVKRIAVTGGAGQIAYQFLFRAANGDLFGRDQPIALQILEVPEVLSALEGIKMELEDCAYPLLSSVTVTSDPYEAFNEVDCALLIGAKPRGPGMERGDLLKDNGKIFIQQGKALNESAKQHAKIIVVGNPCNTNCLIALHHAPRLNPNNFYAMTRLDQNRASSFLAKQAKVHLKEVSNVTIWGNHSSTQVPDFQHALIHGKPVEEAIKDSDWLENQFMELVRKRGAAIIQARGKSSAASAAHALIETVRDLENPTKAESWFSIARLSNENPYGFTENLIFSFPCIMDRLGKCEIVPDLNLSEFLRSQIAVSEKELLEERDLIKHLLKG